jgi:N-acetylglucosamine-6-phosphate deacetylase
MVNNAMPSFLIHNAHIITPHETIENGVVIVDGSKITYVGKERPRELPQGVQIIDAQGNYLAPGFIDIHVNGGGGADVLDVPQSGMSALETIAVTHAKCGSTSIVPTAISCSTETMLTVLENIHRARHRAVCGATILGAHLEGPYISLAQRGAHDANYIRLPDAQAYEQFFTYADDICIVTTAPEVKGALDYGKVALEHGIVASIGHSDATYDDVVKALEVGFSLVTHIYSGMSGVRRVNLFRVPGVIESALLFDELMVEMIADGIHLPPSLMKLVIKVKQVNNVILVTDAIRAAGMPDGHYMLGGMKEGQPIIVEQGSAKTLDNTSFAGSTATMNTCVRNLMRLVGVSLQNAVTMATVNPAKVLGIDDSKGSVSVGKDADIVIFDADINVLMTMCEGQIVFQDQSFHLTGGSSWQ